TTLMTLPTNMKRVSAMSSEIVPTSSYVKSLKEKYKDLDVPTYKLKEWFSTSRQVFFNCENKDKNACLEQLLKRRDLEAFVILFVVKESSGSYRFMDASFRNLGTETLEHFINRFHKQLEAMTKLGVQATGLEYMECVGHS
ncbi:MAG: hypothetical protein ACETVM_01595, partial [Candidatus Bathyarchaeia archaeon]